MSDHPFFAYLAEVAPAIDADIEKKLALLTEGLEGVSENDKNALADSARGGKRLRGALTCLTCEALGGRREDAIPRATCVELIHAATLTHDDIYDGDKTRRGKPASWVKLGEKRAILLGDLILGTTVFMSNELSREDGRMLAQAIGTVARGAFMEPLDPQILLRDLTAGTFPKGLYNAIITMKTGALIGCAAKMGANAAHAPVEVQERAYQYGLRMGSAFQIADDLKDIMNIAETGVVEPGHLVTLGPAYLYFYGADDLPAVLTMMQPGKISDSLLEKGLDMAGRMSDEIKARLAMGCAEMQNFPENKHTQMLRTLPEALVAMMLNKG